MNERQADITTRTPIWGLPIYTIHWKITHAEQYIHAQQMSHRQNRLQINNYLEFDSEPRRH